MGSKIIHTEWIGGTIGIVICEDEYSHQRIAYIGNGSGDDEDIDIQHIKDHGVPTPIDIFEDIVQHMKKG